MLSLVITDPHNSEMVYFTVKIIILGKRGFARQPYWMVSKVCITSPLHLIIIIIIIIIMLLKCRMYLALQC